MRSSLLHDYPSNSKPETIIHVLPDGSVQHQIVTTRPPPSVDDVRIRTSLVNILHGCANSPWTREQSSLITNLIHALNDDPYVPARPEWRPYFYSEKYQTEDSVCKIQGGVMEIVVTLAGTGITPLKLYPFGEAKISEVGMIPLGDVNAAIDGGVGVKGTMQIEDSRYVILFSEIPQEIPSTFRIKHSIPEP